MEMELWLTKHTPTICPPCGEGKKLPHYDEFGTKWSDARKRAVSVAMTKARQKGAMNRHKAGKAVI